ncbi:MAG: DEAD/DEAH box helicase family protein, partial [Clostridia bacterium]|nr:DEAD/DEAH box helicase family protein [Clostridia bacterium]
MEVIAEKIVKVAVEKVAYHFDKLFDYIIPIELRASVKVGSRVLVPFGRGNRKRQAIVFEIAESSDLEKVKPISRLLDQTPLLTQEMLSLAQWIKSNYYCTLFEAARVMLPSGLNVRIVCSYRAREGLTLEELESIEELTSAERQMVTHLVSSCATVERDRLLEVMGLSKDSDIPERLVRRGLILRTDDAVRKTGDATIRMVRIAPDKENISLQKLTPKQREVVELLTEAGSASAKEVCYFTGVTQAVITGLQKRGIVEYFDNEVYRKPYKPDDLPARDVSDIVLTQEQSAAYENMLARYRSGEASTTLLYGVTGSGKTSVFLKLIDDVVADGRGVIVMVPEIALTPQTLGRFRSRYGDRTAVFHSGLSLGQRMDEWKRVKRG